MAESIRLAMIVAAADNGIIGRNNALPWHLPEDLRHFRRVTLGKPIIMGRRTFDSLGKPLPGRTNIVISRHPPPRQGAYEEEGVRPVESLQQAIALAADIALIDGVEEAVVIGGSEIYRLALPYATRLYFTAVHAVVEGDTALADIDWSQWREVSRERHAAQAAGEYDYSFIRYDRLDSLPAG